LVSHYILGFIKNDSLTNLVEKIRRLRRLKIFLGRDGLFFRLSAKKDYLSLQNSFGGEAAALSHIFVREPIKNLGAKIENKISAYFIYF